MADQNPQEGKKIVVSIGELLWDLFPDSQQPGGAPANVAFHIDRLGCKGMICSRVGADSLGNELLEELKKRWLITSYIQEDPKKPTGTVKVDVSDSAEPNYTIYEDVAWDNIEWNEELIKLIQKASAVCYGTLAQRSNKSRETIWKCLEEAQAALKVYDVNLRQKFYKKKWIEFSLQRADVVKLNNVEVAVIGSLFEIDATSFIKFARKLIEVFNLQAVCITRGNRGCIAVSQDQTADIPAFPKQAVDPVGAGDAFTAGFTYALLHKWPLMKAATFANRVGALTTTKQGAMPVLQTEYAALEEEMLEDTER
jgi:fructokinase